LSHFTSKLALGKADETAHRRLVKYSKGEFQGPTIEINAKGRTLAINGSPEYEDLIGRVMAEHAPSEMEFSISGATKCPEDQTDVLRNAGLDIQMSKAKGKDRYEAKLNDDLIPTKALRDIYSGLADDCHILLTIKPASGGREWSMSTKKDYPRPSPKGEIKGSGTDFCKAILPLSDELAKDVLSEVVPDFEGEIKTPFKQLKVENHYTIDEVILPENKEKLSYTEIRLGAKKKGTLVRKATVDGKELTKEKQFCI
jgi:hypothetical protein